MGNYKEGARICYSPMEVSCLVSQNIHTKDKLIKQ